MKLASPTERQIPELFNQELKRETNEQNVKTEDKSTEEILKPSQENITIHKEFSANNQKENKLSLSLSLEKKRELVKKAEGCSTRATMKLLSEQDPALSVSKEQARFLGNGKVEIKVVIDESCHKKLEELKNLLSHKNPALSYRELFSILSEEALKKHDPRKKKLRRKSTQNKIATSASGFNNSMHQFDI